MRVLCFPFFLLAAISCTVPAQEQPAPAQRGPLELVSDYFVRPLEVPGLGRARTIALEVDLEGKAPSRLSLDPNTCMLSPFGDRQACTEIAPKSYPVTPVQAKLADPTGKGRRLFLLKGTPGKAVLHLVVPKSGESGHRLLIADSEGTITAIVPLRVLVRQSGK